MINFVTNLFIALVTFVYLLAGGKIRKIYRDVISERAILLPMAIFDNTAWVAFAFALSVVPIAVATALSESYIIIAVILGLVFNKERLQAHQKIGLIIALVSAIILAAVTA